MIMINLTTQEKRLLLKLAVDVYGNVLTNKDGNYRSTDESLIFTFSDLELKTFHNITQKLHEKLHKGDC